MATWEEKTGDSQTLVTKQQIHDPVPKKMEGEDQFVRLSSVLHMCTHTTHYTHEHTLMCTHHI